MKKGKSNKKAANAEVVDESAKDPPHLVETPKTIRRRNSLDSLRGLSSKGKASISDLKSVVSNLESEVFDIKNSIPTKQVENFGQISEIQYKIVQLDNTLKTKISQLSSPVMILELDNDTLKPQGAEEPLVFANKAKILLPNERVVLVL